MYAKYVFEGTKKLPVVRKKVSMLQDQNDCESHCLWQDVTFNLKTRTLMQQLKQSTT